MYRFTDSSYTSLQFLNQSVELKVTLDDLHSARGLKIGHMNCRSMFLKQIDIQQLLGDLNICCLGETWLHDLYTDDLILWEGKMSYRQDRITETWGGGLITYIDEHIFPYTELVEEATFQDEVIECLTIRINQEKHKRMAIMNVYRPPKLCTEGFIRRLKEAYSGFY